MGALSDAGVSVYGQNAPEAEFDVVSISKTKRDRAVVTTKRE